MSAYPRRVGALRGALDLPAQPEVGYLADQLRINQHVARRQVAVHVVHLAEVLHARRDAAQHADQLQHLELAVVGLNEIISGRVKKMTPFFSYSEKGVQRAVLHVLGDDHHRVGLGDHPLQEYDVRMLELAHDRGLGQEVVARLLVRPGLQRLDGHVDFVVPVYLQFAFAYVAKLPATYISPRSLQSPAKRTIVFT